MPDTIRLQYLDLAEQDLTSGLLLEAFNVEAADAIKHRAIAKLGITPLDGEKPLDAWIRHLSDINGLVYTKPCHTDLCNAILENAAARRLLWLLA